MSTKHLWEVFPSFDKDKTHTVGYLYGSLVREVAAVHQLDYAYDTARSYLEGREATQDGHETFGVKRGDFA